MRKLFFALFLSILWTNMALAQTIDGITYTLNTSANTATVTNTPSGSVVIPATVTYNNRKYNVTAITGVNSGVTSVEIPEGVTSIGTAFQQKYSLTSIVIPSTVQRIEKEAFYNCYSLISVTLPEGITYIGTASFYNCSGLQSITIPTTLTSMGANSFNGCKKLSKITWNSKNCTDFASESVAPFIDFSNGYSHGNNYTTSIIFGEEVEYIPAYLCSGFKNLLTIVFPNRVREIGKYAFCSKSGDNALKSIKFGTSLEYIGSYAFYGKNNITSIMIPDKCTTIGTYAFGQCSNLSLISIGKGITTIGNSAFCENSKINIYATTPPVITMDVFSSISDLMAITLNVRSKAFDAYKAAAVWKDMYVQPMENDIRTFTLSVSSSDENKGKTTQGGEYDEGSEILMYAAANDGYRFSKWNDGNIENPRTVKMIGNLNYVAQLETFVSVLYSLNIEPENSEQGWTTEGGTFEPGRQVMIYAHPANGYIFSQWSDGNKENPRFLNIYGNMNLTAQFEVQKPNSISATKSDTTSASSVRKVVRNGQVFIEYEDKTYTMQGIEVK